MALAFKKTAQAVVVAGIAGLAAITSPHANAQQAALPYTQAQCRDATIIINSELKKVPGQLSPGFARSVSEFVQSGCDVSTKILRYNAADEEVYSRIRVRLIALRTAEAKSLDVR